MRYVVYVWFYSRMGARRVHRVVTSGGKQRSRQFNAINKQSTTDNTAEHRAGFKRGEVVNSTDHAASTWQRISQKVEQVDLCKVACISYIRLENTHQRHVIPRSSLPTGRFNANSLVLPLGSYNYDKDVLLNTSFHGQAEISLGDQETILQNGWWTRESNLPPFLSTRRTADWDSINV